jgi:hypothetical protein
MRKTTPLNSTPNRLPLNPEKLNMHYRDLRRLNKHQNSPNTVTREKLSMAKGKPQQTGMTAEINSIPLYAI